MRTVSQYSLDWDEQAKYPSLQVAERRFYVMRNFGLVSSLFIKTRQRAGLGKFSCVRFRRKVCSGGSTSRKYKSEHQELRLSDNLRDSQTSGDCLKVLIQSLWSRIPWSKSWRLRQCRIAPWSWSFPSGFQPRIYKGILYYWATEKGHICSPMELIWWITTLVRSSLELMSFSIHQDTSKSTQRPQRQSALFVFWCAQWPVSRHIFCGIEV